MKGFELKLQEKNLISSKSPKLLGYVCLLSSSHISHKQYYHRAFFHLHVISFAFRKNIKYLYLFFKK